MAKKKQLQSALKDPLSSLLLSEGFRQLIQRLEYDHPVHKGLPPAATLEQRALKQCTDQEFESVLQKLKKWSVEAKTSSIESTYEPQVK